MHANIQKQNKNRRNWPWGLGRNHRTVIEAPAQQMRKGSIRTTPPVEFRTGDLVRRVVRVAKAEGRFQLPCCGHRQHLILHPKYLAEGLRCNCPNKECPSSLLILFDPDNQAAIQHQPLRKAVPKSNGNLDCPNCGVLYMKSQYTLGQQETCWHCEWKFTPYLY